MIRSAQTSGTRDGAAIVDSHGPHDPVLPHLAEALDTEHMGRTFERRMFGVESPAALRQSERFYIQECRIEHVRYRPGRRAMIDYRLTVGDRVSGEAHEQFMNACLYRAGTSRTRYCAERRRELVAPRFGPPLMHIEFLEMIVWAFPNDRTLDRLAVFDDSARLTDEILPEVVASRWGSDYRIATCDRSVANYVPHGRYCFRVDLRLAHGPTGRVRPWSIYGKGRKGDKAEVLHRTLCRLWNSESRIRGEIVIPRPLGYQPEYGLFWQEALDGRTLVLDADDASMFGRAGAAIARLHRTPVACDRRIRVADVTALLRANVGLLGQVRPATRVTLSAVHDRLAQRAPHLDHETVATLHDDLHPENMLVDGERIALIDLDGVSLGPPAYELGCFVARVLHRALLEGKAPTAVHPIIQRFLKGYRAHADWPMPAADIVWYTAAALVNERAFRSVKGLKSTFLETLDDLLGLAQIISNGGDQALAVTLGSNA